MGKLFKFLKPRVGAVLAIVAVLIIQAYCDLSLPGYTSDIVNVGIQQGGIDSAIPEQIAKDDMEKLLLFVSKDDQKIVMDAYTLDSKTYKKDAYVLKDDMLKDEDKEEKLIDILGKPMLLVSGFDSDSETSKQMKQAIFANVPQEMLTEDTTIYDVLSMMPEEQRLQMTKQLDEKMEEMPKVKELDAEFAELLTKKKASYPDYRKARDEMQELVRAQKNVERFFAEEKDTTEKTQTR